jgi:Zn finger protein HypA/HybF involved in hydrogenase expression
MKVKIQKIKCKRCGHEWQPRHEDVRQCPNCQSIYWDKEKKKENEKN